MLSSLRRMFFKNISHMRRSIARRPWRWALGTVVGVLFVYFAFIGAPFSFPVGAYVSIPDGTTLSGAAQILKDRGIIRSEIVFEVLVKVFGTERHVIAGEYFFPSKAAVLRVALRLGSGDFEITPTRVRVSEGATVQNIGAGLAKAIPGFDLAEFQRDTKGKEGYLFPDTYFFMPGESTQEILGAFSNDFSTHIATIQKQIDAFGKPLSDVITMASLLEREAPDTQDRRIIAGILWKRIKLGMPLQVDATFGYILGSDAFPLSAADLKVQSPYNTYTHTGLPPGPIANPSLDAILAAVTPVSTNYLYYLSDNNGTIHYSATYAQHLAAKAKYLGD